MIPILTTFHLFGFKGLFPWNFTDNVCMLFSIYATYPSYRSFLDLLIQTARVETWGFHCYVVFCAWYQILSKHYETVRCHNPEYHNLKIENKRYKLWRFSSGDFVYPPCTSSAIELINPPTTFLFPQNQRLKFTPIQNNRQDYIFIYCNFCHVL